MAHQLAGGIFRTFLTLLLVVVVVMGCLNYLAFFRGGRYNTTTGGDGPVAAAARRQETGRPGGGDEAARGTARPPPQRPWCSGRMRPSDLGLNSTFLAARRLEPNQTYFLTAVLVVRIYARDINKLTSREISQWLQYLSYTGLEHVYVYDCYVHKNESQREALACFVRSGFVTYVDWSHMAVDYTNRALKMQTPAYQDCLDRFGHQFAWQTAIDIDEYPFCRGDRKPGFLARFLQSTLADPRYNRRQNLAQIFMQNFIYIGDPPDVVAHPLLVDRFLNLTAKVWNGARKPIFLAKAVARARIHTNVLSPNYTQASPKENIIRLSHYHGARYFKSTKIHVAEVAVVEDRSMDMAAAALRRCLDGCVMGCCSE